MEPYLEVRESYAAFAREAADSPCFVDWSLGVRDDSEVQALIGTLPAVKQQPNLVFASARWLGVTAPGPYAGLRELLLSRWDEVRSVVLARSTQTNEVRRLATLLPAFTAAVDSGPVALIEVGASAGLNLYPDRWSFRWSHNDGSVAALGDGDPLDCDVEGALPLPDTHPEVSWRGGVDLNPLDVTDPDAMAWLENLVWPEQDARRERLRTAIAIAVEDPPDLRVGDLIETLPAMLEEVPDDSTAIVFHSAVIAYLPPQRRTDFQALMSELVAAGRCHWVSNEGPGVLPEITRTAPARDEDDTRFVLGLDGRAVGFAHGHGASVTWFG